MDLLWGRNFDLRGAVMGVWSDNLLCITAVMESTSEPVHEKVLEIAVGLMVHPRQKDRPEMPEGWDALVGSDFGADRGPTINRAAFLEAYGDMLRGGGYAKRNAEGFLEKVPQGPYEPCGWPEQRVFMAFAVALKVFGG